MGDETSHVLGPDLTKKKNNHGTPSYEIKDKEDTFITWKRTRDPRPPKRQGEGFRTTKTRDSAHSNLFFHLKTQHDGYSRDRPKEWMRIKKNTNHL